jgi:DHA1 family tetracycline resistance protein-like MFS transporter
MEAGLLFSLLGLVATAIQGGALGRLARWAGERPLLRGGALAMAAGLALLPLCRTSPALFLTLAVMALGFAVITPIAQTLLSRLSPAAEQASNLGVGQSMSSLARACGPLAGGFLFGHLGTASPFWAAALLLVGAAALVGVVPAFGAGSERSSPGVPTPPDVAAVSPGAEAASTRTVA